jgi:hypothetical protein
VDVEEVVVVGVPEEVRKHGLLIVRLFLFSFIYRLSIFFVPLEDRIKRAGRCYQGLQALERDTPGLSSNVVSILEAICIYT